VDARIIARVYVAQLQAEKEATDEPTRFSQQPPLPLLSTVGRNSLLSGFVGALLPGGYGLASTFGGTVSHDLVNCLKRL